MSLTKWQDASDLLKQSYDVDYYDSMYRRLRFSMGHSWKSWNGSGAGSGDIPCYPDVQSLYHEVGVGNNIITAQAIAVESAMYAEPRPEFPQLNEVSAEVRQKWFLARRNGAVDWVPDQDPAKGKRATGGGWAEDDHYVVMDGDGLGSGFLQVGLEVGESGRQRVTARHSPRLYTLGDRSERNPAKWRYIAFIQPIAYNQAVAMFGADVAANHKTYSVDSGTDQSTFEVVNIIDYWDIGTFTGEPTHIVWVGTHNSEPVKRERNPFGILPFSFYANIWHAGMQNPTGRIEQQMPLEAIQQEIEAYITAVMRYGKGFTVMHEELFNADDVRRWKDGADISFLRLKVPQANLAEIFMRVPPMQISSDTFATLQYFFRKETMASGVNELQRGVELKGNQTLGEVNAVRQEGSTPQAWMAHRLSQYYVRTVNVATVIGAMYDRAPVLLDVLDAQVPFNMAGDPKTDIRPHLAQPTRCLISEDTLRYKDQQNERNSEIAKWGSAAGLLMQLATDPAYLREKMLEALGEKDPSRAALKTQPMNPDPLNAPQGAAQNAR